MLAAYTYAELGFRGSPQRARPCADERLRFVASLALNVPLEFLDLLLIPGDDVMAGAANHDLVPLHLRRESNMLLCEVLVLPANLAVARGLAVLPHVPPPDDYGWNSPCISTMDSGAPTGRPPAATSNVDFARRLS